MSQIPLPSFLLVPDTNVLFSKTPSSPISKGFVKTWETIRSRSDIKLIIPAIVRDELIARRVHVSKEAFENACKNLGTIEQLSGLTPRKLPEPKLFERGVAKIIDRCFVEIVAKSEPIPKNTRWKNITRAAVLRIPPFTSFKSLDEETLPDKGFKDALLLETFDALVKRSGRGAINVLLSKDELVKRAFEDRYGRAQDCLIFGNLEEFGSYLSLLHENKKSEIANKIQQIAGSIFYRAGDASSLYYRDKVAENIRTLFHITLDSIFDFQKNSTSHGSLNIIGGMPLLQPVSEDKYFIQETVLDSYTEQIGFRWKTRVQVVKLFKHATVPTQSWWNAASNESFRLTDIDVFWTATIDSNGEFESAKISEYKIASSKLTAADYLTKTRYGVPIFEVKPTTY